MPVPDTGILFAGREKDSRVKPGYDDVRERVFHLPRLDAGEGKGATPHHSSCPCSTRASFLPAAKRIAGSSPAMTRCGKASAFSHASTPVKARA